MVPFTITLVVNCAIALQTTTTVFSNTANNTAKERKQLCSDTRQTKFTNIGRKDKFDRQL